MTIALSSAPLTIDDLDEGHLTSGGVYMVRLDAGESGLLEKSFELWFERKVPGAKLEKRSEETFRLRLPDDAPKSVSLHYKYRDRNEVEHEDVVPIDVHLPEPPITSLLDLSSGSVPVSLQQTSVKATDQVCLWMLIRKGHEAISFENYARQLDALCTGNDRQLSFKSIREVFKPLQLDRSLPFNDTDTYRYLKIATEAFLISQAAVWSSDPKERWGFSAADRRDAQIRTGSDLSIQIGGNGQGSCADLFEDGIPYLVAIAEKLGFGADLPLQQFSTTENTQWCSIINDKLRQPFLVELIWSYWNEEGMLAQTMGAISRRFQNISDYGTRDPLVNLEIGPLRGLNNLLWGYIQDEQHRLSLTRRAYEYDHHYGLRLQGSAVPRIRAAESRSKFLEAFHNLLTLCSQFFRQDDDTTVVADGFPLLNALRDVHLVLSMGAHNQFGDLPSTARIEMLMQQWILSRKEFSEFLPRRDMVRYPEPWMDRVDAMKSLQGWSDVSVMHFGNLANFGEGILLSVRYTDWNSPALTRDDAKLWARFWRSEIQGYIHAYRVVTGIDLAADAVDTRQQSERYLQPSVLINRRMAAQSRPQPIGMNGASPKPIGAPARALVRR